MKKTLLIIAGCIALILGLFVNNLMSPRPLSSIQYQELGYFGFPAAREIKPFEMLNEVGEPVGVQSLQGQWSLLFFGFTYCPDICPTTLGVLNRAVAQMQSMPQVVLVTVDPERDSPAQLKQYLAAFNPSFKGYSGTFDSTVALATNVNVAFGKLPGDLPDTYTMDHSASIVVVDPAGRYAGFIKAPHQAEKIAKIMNSLQL